MNELERFKQTISQKRYLLELIGSIAAIAALFLQVQIQNNSLRYIQSLLLFVLVLVISYSIFDLWYSLFIKDKKETDISISVSLIYSAIAFLFLWHIYRFTWVTYNFELSQYLSYSKIGIVLLFYHIINRVSKSFAKKHKPLFLYVLIPELAWLLLSIFILNGKYFTFGENPWTKEKGLMLGFLILLSVNSIFESELKFYSRRVGFFILLSLTIIFIAILYL